MFKKIVSLVLSISLVITQPIFAQGLSQLNLAQYLGQMHPLAADIFLPTQLRYFSYDNLNNSYRILLDKGDLKDIKDNQLKEEAKELMDYFLIGLALPNDTFWVNLRPDSPDNIIDPELEKTDLGRILLEADLQLKKDTANFTSPKTPEGKQYWDKLYKKAGELFGTENITIPTITRPWIVPGEIIVRESQSSAYIYKATLKVMIEEDYISSQPSAVSFQQYTFSDPRLKELNEYSTQIIRETIIPKLTQEVNSSKRYAQLRQVYYSLVLSRWFKMRFSGKSGQCADLIDKHDLTNLTTQEPYDKRTYFKEYQKSFAQGEYNLKEPVYTPYGQSIRAYMSGGFTAIDMNISGPKVKTETASNPAEQQLLALPGENTVILDKNFEIVDPEQSLALAASALSAEEFKVKLKENLKKEKITFDGLLEIFSEVDKNAQLDYSVASLIADILVKFAKQEDEKDPAGLIYFRTAIMKSAAGPFYTEKMFDKQATFTIINVLRETEKALEEKRLKIEEIGGDIEEARWRVIVKLTDDALKAVKKAIEKIENQRKPSVVSPPTNEEYVVNDADREKISGSKVILDMFSYYGEELVKRYPDSKELYEETEKKLKTYWETEETYDIQKAAEAALEFYTALQSKGLNVEPEIEKKIKMLQDTG